MNTQFAQYAEQVRSGHADPHIAVINWSPQQKAFLEWCRTGTGSCVLEAKAGAGKSTTLVEGARVIYGCVALMAFNKKIAQELEKKITKAGMTWKKAKAGTAHSFGFNAYRKEFPGVQIDDDKVSKLIEQHIADPDMIRHHGRIRQLVGLAKQAAIGIVVPMESDADWVRMADHHDIFEEVDYQVPEELRMKIIELARYILLQSIHLMNVIDFSDMIYMPLYHKVRFWQYDVVMIDEAQDTNAARRALIRAMLKRGGRVVAVGDRNQAIYGFTGADSDALDLIAKDHNCIELPLTVSYRCPQSVVRYAQQWVPNIQASDAAAEGSVSDTTMEAFLKRNDLNGDSAVLSRTNKPLVSLAFQLIRMRIACKIEGRDIGNKIKKLILRWKVKTLDALDNKLDVYLEREKTKLLAKRRESQVAQLEDEVETIRVIMDQCRKEGKHTVADAAAFIDSLFADNVEDILVLSSIHKAKGREWKRVFWLDKAGTCPSKWARQAWQQQQERNLMYVATTRAQEHLIHLRPGDPAQARPREE